MKELFEQIKTELPKFLVTFISILTTPRDGLLKTISLYQDNKKEEFITKSIIYYLICNLIAGFIFLSPIYGSGDFESVLKFSYSLFITLMFVILSALAMKLSWNLVGEKRPYFKYFIASSYHVGTFLIVYSLLIVINLSILRFSSVEKYQMMIKCTFLGGKDYPLEDRAVIIYEIINVAIAVFMFVWFYKGWTCYRIMNKSTKWKSFFAAIIFAAIMTLVFFIDIMVDKMLNNRNY
jgi:hypothetical protein